jgi:hypothetical protein
MSTHKQIQARLRKFKKEWSELRGLVSMPRDNQTKCEREREMFLRKKFGMVI